MFNTTLTSSGRVFLYSSQSRNIFIRRLIIIIKFDLKVIEKSIRIGEFEHTNLLGFQTSSSIIYFTHGEAKFKLT